MAAIPWPNNRLTRFEVARLVGARALQIALGAPILAKTESAISPIDVARVEFKSNILPITVKRKLPSNEFVVVQIRKAIENWLAEYNGEI
ncbi:MAG TPA: DNA-directed RNA polymerase subunit K [archaeon]|nr:DNA-directed RNA polymerase subunit K [archaeon]